MNRGIVMENGKRHVIVMMPDGQFRKVPTNKQPQIGEEITFSERARLRRPRALYSSSITAAVVLLLLCLPYFAKDRPVDSEVVAYLTMDINPSIELGINKEEQVEELHAINKDGAAVTANLTYKGLPVDQVAEAIMDRVDAGHYIKNGEGDVIITSVLVHEEPVPAYEQDLKKHIDAAVRKALAKMDKAANQHVEVTTLSAPKEVRDEAKADGLSSGKMSFYLLAKSQGHQVTIQELKTHSIHQTAKAWGGVQSVIQASTLDDSDKEKQEDKQKEQLKKLLIEEKSQEKEKKKEEKDKDKGTAAKEPAQKEEHASVNGKQQSGKSDQNKKNPGQVKKDNGKLQDEQSKGKAKEKDKEKEKVKNDDAEEKVSSYQENKQSNEKSITRNELGSNDDNEQNGSNQNNERDTSKVEGQNQNSSLSSSSPVKEESKHSGHSSGKNKQKKEDSKK